MMMEIVIEGIDPISGRRKMQCGSSGCLLGGVGGLEGGSDALTENPFSILN